MKSLFEMSSAAPVEVGAASFGEQRVQQPQSGLGLFVDGVLLLLRLAVFFLQPPTGRLLELVLEVAQLAPQLVLELFGLRLPRDQLSPGQKQHRLAKFKACRTEK